MLTLPPTAILTRPAGRNGALSLALRAAGWLVLEAPALNIQPAPVAAHEVLPRPQDFDMVVFVSGAAVAGYARQLGPQVHWPAGTIAAAVGPTTARSAQAAFGSDIQVLHPDATMAQDSEALWDVIQARPTLPARVLLVRGQSGRAWLGDELTRHGVFVQAHVAYCREVATWPEATVHALRHLALEDVHPAWLMTSAEGILATLDQARTAGLYDWCQRATFVVTHRRLADFVQKRLILSPETAQIQTCLPEDEALLLCFEQIRHAVTPA